MFGPSQDVPGECNARCFLGDDYGDNTTTLRCKLPDKHEGLHTETCRGPDHASGKVIISWEHDERPDQAADDAWVISRYDLVRAGEDAAEDGVPLEIRCLACPASPTLDSLKWTPDTVFDMRDDRDHDAPVCPECGAVQSVLFTPRWNRQYHFREPLLSEIRVEYRRRLRRREQEALHLGDVRTDEQQQAFKQTFAEAVYGTGPESYCTCDKCHLNRRCDLAFNPFNGDGACLLRC